MTTVDPVAAFYQRFPYPPRNPAAVPDTLAWILPANLPTVAHHVFAGALPRGRALRFLVAGGGTGDAVLALGGWLKRLGLDGSIDYVDLSRASCAIARRRAEAAGLGNVSFRVGPLEALATGPAGEYDYVDFCGVLNHVPDPARALAALAHVIAPGGGIGVMAYGSLGRTGVYEAQAALRLLGVDGSRPDGPALARSFASGLPKSNWLLRNPTFERIAEADDVELADVLLNPRDRAFTTDVLDDLMTGAGLAIRSFIPPFLYDPVPALRDPALKTAAADLDRRGRWRLAELMQGNFSKHVFYAVKPAPGAAAVPGDDDPAERLLADPATVLFPIAIDFPAVAAALAARPAERRSLQVTVDRRAVTVGIRLSDLDLAILAALDGPTRIGAITARVAAGDGVGAALGPLQRKLTRLGLLHLMAG